MEKAFLVLPEIHACLLLPDSLSLLFGDRLTRILSMNLRLGICRSSLFSVLVLQLPESLSDVSAFSGGRLLSVRCLDIVSRVFLGLRVVSLLPHLITGTLETAARGFGFLLVTVFTAFLAGLSLEIVFVHTPSLLERPHCVRGRVRVSVGFRFAASLGCPSGSSIFLLRGWFLREN